MKYFVYTVIAVVVIIVVGGLFIVGSPADERARRFDTERVWNLQSIQREITSYWMNKEVLPENLSDLEDSLTGYIPPRDPRTQESYTYEKLGELSFSLCATFETESEGMIEGAPVPKKPIFINSSPYDSSWEHGIGETCFERTIDPERHNPIKE